MDAVYEQRLSRLESDVSELKAEQKAQHQMHTETLIALRVLQSKLNIMAAGIGMVSGIASSLAVKLLV